MYLSEKNGLSVSEKLCSSDFQDKPSLSDFQKSKTSIIQLSENTIRKTRGRVQAFQNKETKKYDSCVEKGEISFFVSVG